MIELKRYKLGRPSTLPPGWSPERLRRVVALGSGLFHEHTLRRFIAGRLLQPATFEAIRTAIAKERAESQISATNS